MSEYFIDNGSTYAVNIKAFLEQKTFYGKNLKGHKMPRNRSVDLDTPEDLSYLEFLAKKEEKKLF